MALITCPDCKKNISENALSCPNCGNPLSPEIVAKIKDEKEKNMKIGCIVIITIILLFYFFSSKKSPEDYTYSEFSTSPNIITNDKETTPFIPKLHVKDQLKKELSCFEKPFRTNIYRGAVECLQLEDVLFSLWAKIIQEGELSEDLETKTIARELKIKVSELQRKEFPEMRREYARLVASKLLENNIYVTTEGPRDDILNFTGTFLSDYKNIEEIQNILSVILTQFRFKETRYRSYNGESEYYSYKLFKSDDSEVRE